MTKEIEEYSPTIIKTENAFILKIPHCFIMERRDWRFVLMLEFMNLMAQPEDFMQSHIEEGEKR